MQKFLNRIGIRDNNDNRLHEDGIFGTHTKEACVSLENLLTKEFYNQNK